MGKKWNRETCIQAIEGYIQANQQIPLTKDLHTPLPLSSIFERYVGQSVAKYCLEYHPELSLNHGSGRFPIWNRENCIQAIEAYIHDHQTIPRMQELLPPLPRGSTFKQYVGQTVSAYCAEHHPELFEYDTRQTKEQIRAATDAFYAKHGRQAKAVEHRAYNSLPSHNTITACFNMTAREYWDTFYPEPEPQWTVEMVLEALKDYHTENGRLPTQGTFFDSAAQFPTKAVFQKLSGGMEYADFLQLHLPGLAENRWTQENIIKAVRLFEEKYGSLPRTTDFTAANGLPPITTLYRKFPCQKLDEVYAQWLPGHQMRRAHSGNGKWDETGITQALRKFVEKNQRLPLTYEYSEQNGLPSYGTVRKFLGKPVSEACQELFPEFCPAPDAHEPDEEQDYSEGVGGMVMSM